MPIVYEPKKDCFCPRVICDICCEAIEEPENAIATWSEDGKRIVFAHKAFAHKMKCALQVGWKDGFPFWESLDQFLFNLQHNTKYNPKKARKQAEVLRTWGLTV